MPQSKISQDLLKIVNVFARKAITQLEKHLSKKENLKTRRKKSSQKRGNTKSIMHWLHVNPNSDFSTFWHFLEEFWTIICRHFAKKVLEILAFVVFLADNLQLADFQHFFGKVSVNIWKERSIWQTFGIWFLYFF